MVSGEAKEIALRSSRLFSGRLASRTRASVFRARETRKALHRGDAHVIMRALTRSNAALFPGGGGGGRGQMPLAARYSLGAHYYSWFPRARTGRGCFA
jgi:hypothetical protein